MNSLVDTLSQVLIIAYKEPTQQLEEYLTKEGFECLVIRQEDKPEYQQFSPSYRCMLNHRQAWEIATQQSQPSLIVEADFVPVLEFGQLPLPFDKELPNLGITWIYTCSPQVYWVSPEGYAEGFSTGMVAYIVSPKAAELLIKFSEKITETTQGKTYSTWDSEIDTFLRSHNLQNFIPFRNYGEHGGLANPEHRKHGLSPGHQADVLWGEIAFDPLYTQAYNPQLIRAKARLKGILRLLAGYFVRIKTLRNSRVPWRLISFSFGRQLTLRL
ncbi:LPS biosynthesis glycosyltransferase [Limnospira indica]|uniref:LPS biosynthesis glycosyltransferase n=1 Tax=Limnospira indica TaxID=147322 RepID=UPI00061B3EA9|nr:LPS biosynthesis glycosyltransferase [Limnospira indica]QNH57077.1 MAG: LPS biosynthesis glycosyltransferase [Limnospira indica BM01]